MNNMYGLAINIVPTMPLDFVDRLDKFKKTLGDEVKEIQEIIDLKTADGVEAETEEVDGIESEVEVVDTMEAAELNIQVMVQMADLLADVVVYCRSEALKFGIPLEEVLDIVMDSNESKLGADGKPIYDENKKFLKGPNYWKPEEKIKQLLLAKAGGEIKQGNWD
jgi:predicted HAD superfamily Cof-like phosphohydrolase